MSEPLKIAIAGLGTVGLGTLELLTRQADLLSARCGRPLIVTSVSARDPRRDRGVDLSAYRWYDDATEMASRADVDVVVELIGGSGGIARNVLDVAITAGRHVVTANKALLALHGTELAYAAESAGVVLAYEAAVGGGIPVIKALREGLAGNRVTRIHGILNGTCNYILTTMRETGRAFEDVLAEAQALGYAEADPGFDIDGIDTAHKLAILTGLAFGRTIDFADVHVEGIRHVSSLDIAYATELGYRIKLLGVAECTEAGILQRVHPAMVPLGAPIASVEGVYNGIEAEGDFVGTTVFEGRGAGAGPTASAVVGDLVDIACGRRSPTFGVPVAELSRHPAVPMECHVGCYYVRFTVLDEPGVFADIATALRNHRISIESVIQRARSRTGGVPVVLTTHETAEASMRGALAAISRLKSVTEEPCMIRIEKF